MKRVLLLCSVLLLACGAAWGNDKAAPGESQIEEPEECLGQSVEEILEDYRLKAEQAAIPPCPENTVCSLNGGTTCTSSTQCGGQGRSTFTDTGERKCNGPSSPPPFQCPPGQTIHIETKQCRVCPCCTVGPPFCVCLNPPQCTGSVVVGFTCQ